MTWQLILTSALISGIVSSIIALYANERMKKVEFNFDYKKYILQKRVSTYQMIEELINKLLEEGFERHYISWFFIYSEDGIKGMNEMIDSIHKITCKNMWLSKAIITELTETSIILRRALKVAENSKGSNINITKEKEDNLRALYDRLASLQKHYFFDVSKMNNIDSFMKMKNLHMDSIIENVKILASKQKYESESSNVTL